MTVRHDDPASSNTWLRVARTALFATGITPLVWLVWRIGADRLGANPIEAIEHVTGWWTLTLLMVTLAVTPLRLWTGWAWLARLRRMAGLLAFVWACLHLCAYAALDQFFALGEIVEDIVKRPYITVGFATFLLLVPLAVTSSDQMVRRLGGSRWRTLHRLVYLAAAGGIMHFLWLVKADISRPLLFAAVLVVLLAARLPRFRTAKVRSTESAELLSEAGRGSASRRVA